MDFDKAMTEFLALEKAVYAKLDSFETHQQAAEAAKISRTDVTNFLNHRIAFSYKKMMNILKNLEAENDTDRCRENGSD